jgi:hypothetical protein
MKLTGSRVSSQAPVSAKIVLRDLIGAGRVTAAGVRTITKNAAKRGTRPETQKPAAVGHERHGITVFCFPNYG